MSDKARVAAAEAPYSDEIVGMLELIMLAGFYHTVAYITNGLRLPLEEFGARFPG
jgi:hypothetical protein